MTDDRRPHEAPDEPGPRPVLRRPHWLAAVLMAAVAVVTVSGTTLSGPLPEPSPGPPISGSATGRSAGPPVAAHRGGRPSSNIEAPLAAPPGPPLLPPPGPPPLDAGPLARMPRRAVPILYYHRVESIPPDFRSWGKHRRRTFLAYDLLPTAFLAQLDWLKANGFHTILPRDLAAHWDRGTRLPSRPVILAFDDGSSTWMHKVLPALRRRGMVAEFYLTLDAIKHGNLTWAEVRRLARAGNGIGAHDVHHVQLAGVPGRRPASRRRMFAEVDGARRAIEANVGIAPDSMAYVGGGFDRRLIAQVRRAGYTTARSVLRGIHQRIDSRYTLRVVRVGARDDVRNVTTGALDPRLPEFAAKVTGRRR